MLRKGRPFLFVAFHKLFDAALSFANYPRCTFSTAVGVCSLRLASKQFLKGSFSVVGLDFKPELTEAKILDLLKQRGDLNVKELLQTKINLSDTTFQLIKLITTKEEYNNPAILANLIKHYSVTITDLAPIDEAISTVGGIPFNELTENFELKKLPGAYCIGEMVDWDAPTGGYLLQMCFSMGFYLGDVLNKKS